MKNAEVRRLLRVSGRTINNYIRQGILHPVKINPHHYEYDEKEVYNLINKDQVERINITYARVSLNKQKEDLKRQNERLYDFCIANGYTIGEQMQDIKSGMNFTERKQFIRLIDKVINHEVDKVIIENKDRLARFGFELLKEMFRKHGTEIIVMSEVDNKSYEQELTDDLISIIRYYSMKSYSHRRQLHNAQKALEEKDIEN